MRNRIHKVVTKSIHAEVPKMFRENPEAPSRYEGIPEIYFPDDFWEFFEHGYRYSNYKKCAFINQRTEYPGYTGFDFDSRIMPQVVSYLLLKVREDIVYFRPSTTRKGYHFLIKNAHITDSFLAFYEDHIRQEFTRMRGFEWFWKEKNGFKSCEFQIMREIDCLRILNSNFRIFRKDSRKQDKYK